MKLFAGKGLLRARIDAGSRRLEFLESRLCLSGSPVLEPTAEEVQLSILPSASLLSTPATITANVTGPTSIFIDWSNVPGAVAYKLERSTLPTTGFTQIYFGSTSQYTDSGGALQPNVTYYYRARAYDFEGHSAYTAVVSARLTVEGTIRGTVWDDANQDGVRGPGENGIANWRVYIDQNNNGSFEANEQSQLTDSNGDYAFVGLKPNETYIVRQVLQEGYNISFPTPGSTNPVSEFRIEVVFPDNSLTLAQKAVFQQAADRWSQIILGDLPDVNVPGIGIVDDVRIEATAPFIDGEGGILAGAGPTRFRSGTFLPITGVMEFDSADLASQEASGDFLLTILHEMGHVLGFGTIWEELNLLVGAGTNNPRFIGPQATAEYNAIFGVNENGVPVENQFGPGTQDSHWRESILGDELMTGIADPNEKLSRITVASLADIGYVVDINASDEWNGPTPGTETPFRTARIDAAAYRWKYLDAPHSIHDPIPTPSSAAIVYRSTANTGFWTVALETGEIASGVNFGVYQDGSPAPEIEIRGGDVVIEDGDTIPSVDDLTDFGTVNVNGATSVRTFTIFNLGSAPLILSIPPGGVITGTNAADFRVFSAPESTIAPGGSTSFQIEFDPSGAGLRTAMFNIGSNDFNENPYNFAIQGRGGDAPAPATMGGFVWDDVDGDGIQNNGEGPLAGITIYIDNDNDGTLDTGELVRVTDENGLFSFGNLLLGSYVVRQALPPSREATFPSSGFYAVNLAPGESRTGLDFGSTAIPAPAEIDVLGNGISIEDGDKTPSRDDGTDFGILDTVGASVTHTFTIANTGEAALLLSGTPRVSVAGLHASDFEVTLLPAASIVGGATTTFQIRFDPSGVGLRKASVFISSNDSDEALYDFDIRGLGAVAGSDVGDTIATARVTTLGDAGGALNLAEVIGNGPNGLRDVDVYRFEAHVGALLTATTVPDTNGLDFDTYLRLYDADGNQITANDNYADVLYSQILAFQLISSGTYYLAVSGAPNADYNVATGENTVEGDTGSYRLIVSLDAGNRPEIQVSGNSVVITDGDVTPSLADHTSFGAAAVSGQTVTRTFTILNIGTAALLLTGSPRVSISGEHANDFTVLFQPADAVGSSSFTQFAIRFDPSGEGVRSATVSIENNDADENPYNFNISGFGDSAIPDGVIRGQVWNDSNGNGEFDTDETFMSNWTVFIDADNNGVFDGGELAQTTNAQGAYEFIELVRGTAVVRVVVQAGYQQTFPIAGAHTLAIDSGSIFAGRDFGVRLIPLAPPEIEVQGNGVVIFDGDDTPSPTDFTDFGSTLIDGGTVVRLFTIANLGAAPLTLGSLTVTGANPSDFILTFNSPGTVAGGTNTAFQITFNPSAAGVRTAILTINNDDSDEAEYTFAIRGVGINDATPVGVADNVAIPEDTSINIDVLANDHSFDRASLTADDLTQPLNGNVGINANGTIRYTPNLNFHGSDSFTYRAVDSNGVSAATTVNITVTSVNDAPFVIKEIEDVNQGNDATDRVFELDTYFGDVDLATSGDVLTYEVVSNSNTTAVNAFIDGNLLRLDFGPLSRGGATIRVRARDLAGATVDDVFVVTVNVNTPPVVADDNFVISGAVSNATTGGVSVLTNDIDAEGDLLTATLVDSPLRGTVTLNAGGGFTYTRSGQFRGFDEFSYRVSDGQLDSGVATVKVLSYEASQIIKLYRQVLGRDADAAGIEFWFQRIQAGDTYGVVASGIFESDERLTPIIEQYYRDYLLREPDTAGVAFWRDQVWKVDGGPDNVIAGMISSPEFYASAGGTDTLWLNEMYRRLLNREADDAGRQFWLGKLASGELDRAGVVLGFIRSTENFITLVKGYYSQYLGRTPSLAELNSFVVRMRAGLSQRDVQIAIINTVEYSNMPLGPNPGGILRIV